MAALLGVNNPFRSTFITQLGQPVHYIRVFTANGALPGSADWNDVVARSNEGYEVIASWKPNPGSNAGMQAVSAGTWDARIDDIGELLAGLPTPGGICIYHEPEDLTSSIFRPAASRFLNRIKAIAPAWRSMIITQAWPVIQGTGQQWFVPEAETYGVDYYNQLGATDGGNPWANPSANDRNPSDFGTVLNFAVSNGMQDTIICELGCSRLDPAVAPWAQGAAERTAWIKRFGDMWKNDTRLEGVIYFEQGQPNFPHWWLAGSNPAQNPIGVEPTSLAEFRAYATGIVPPPPGGTITSFTPSNGPVGTQVTVNGTLFTGVTAVRFNGQAALFTPISSAQLTAIVPSGATTGRITVITPAGTATSTTNFTVSSVPPPPSGFIPGVVSPSTRVKSAS